MTLGKLCQVKLSGVDAAHSKNEKATPKGVKAFFNMDESGIVRLEKVRICLYFFISNKKVNQINNDRAACEPCQVSIMVLTR